MNSILQQRRNDYFAKLNGDLVRYWLSPFFISLAAAAPSGRGQIKNREPSDAVPTLPTSEAA